MLRLMKERSDLNVVSDQFGSPTYAKDIAETIMQIITQSATNFQSGIYHFSNDAHINWYEFATAIKDMRHLDCNVHAIPTSQYPTPAKRPAYSVMNKEKIQSTFHIQLKPWKESLQECLEEIQ